MPSVLEAPVSTLPHERKSTPRTFKLTASPLLILLLLTPCVLLVHGFHPFADDAGIYVAGVEKMMHPQLFPRDAAFVTAHTRYSIFSHVFAWVLECTHLPLAWGLLAAYLLSIFTFLLGSFQVAQRLFESSRMRWGAVLLAAALFTLPVAATALWLMDPYVTARSFSTPLSFFAIAACLDRRWIRCMLWLAITAAMHPLMAIYLAAFLLTCGWIRAGRWRLLTALNTGSILLVAAGYFLTCHAVLPYGYKEAVLSREYFFLSNWQWFEWLGLIVPLLMMLAAAIKSSRTGAIFAICTTCIATGAASTLCAMLFVHTDGSYFLAHLQFLRTFQLIYALGVLLLGGFLMRSANKPRIVMGILAILCAAAGMGYAGRQSYPQSAHVEWPFFTPKNPWQQAFLWAGQNTPQNAVFALDPEYSKMDGEDLQSFRAISQRSALTDDLKDGGIAAIFPTLAPQWKRENDLTFGLNTMSDAERAQRLIPMGVTWLLLRSNAVTQLPCLYRNSLLKVCRLR